jgi:hypothetical protein
MAKSLQSDQRVCFGGTMDKIKAYGWELKDSPGEMKWIDKTLLKVDHTYQRNHSQSKVLALSSKWSWVACGTIVVGQRKDQYYVIDGQHRVLAAKNRSDIIDLPCIVFTTKSIVEEAVGFNNSNTQRRQISIFASYRAKLVAKDEETLYLAKVLSDLGFHVNDHAEQPMDIACIGACYSAMRNNRIQFERTMKMVKELCAKDPVYDRILQGVFYLSCHLSTDLEDRRLRTRILKTGVSDLLRATKTASAYYSTGGAKVYAMGMLEEINKGLKKKFTFKEE